ncbi:serine-rich adhesin for platelets [Ochlerotatus camptorhynchus]|uniref:serine-rich adhesin for platelets n=1 Tax=Ochlerotatus camptorhynchus TaxID=644619 RepID=UPI0031E12AD7
MEQIVNLFVCFLMISNIYRAYSYPTPSDILSGKEFLAILMDSDSRSGRSNNYASRSTTIQQSTVTAHPYRGSRKFSQFYYGRAEDEESILPIEALFSSHEDTSRSGSRSYDHRTRSRSRNGKLLSSTTSTTETIVTFEDLEVAASEISVSSSGTTEGEVVDSTMSTSEYSIDTDSTSGTMMTSTIPTTVSASQQTETSSKDIDSVHLNEGDRSLNSNSYRSEFTIEESDPSVGHQRKDAERGESTNVHHVMVALESDQPHMQPTRGRMQRKQDLVAPRQTVIYHDKKSENDQPRSVSYSFIGETAPTLKTWKDIDEEYLPKLNGSQIMTAESSMSAVSEPSLSGSAMVWSEPEKNYSEPAKIWSEPAKVYSEPAKFYSEPSRIYSEPAKIYSEPAKIYSKPSSFWQTAYDNAPSRASPSQAAATTDSSTSPKRIVYNDLDKIPYDELNAPADAEDRSSIHNAIGKFTPKQVHDPVRKNFNKPTPDPTEVIDPYVEKQGVGNGSTPNVVQTLAPVAGSTDDSKVGYVVEGRNYRKYRVEEKTSDGFIVGEYGVLSHNDGNLRGVRYTADSDINPRLIYDALIKFLSL